MKRRLLTVTVVSLFILLFSALLYACTPYTEATVDRFPIDHNSDANKDNQYPAHSTARKDAVVDRAADAMDNLLKHLNSDETSDTGYYVGADIAINTEDVIPEERSAFVLKMRANLYTYPYELKDKDGNVLYDEDGNPLVDEEALAIHNEYIKYNDIVLEWYDAMNNVMMIGFYFDGINPNSANPGNDLYLNLLGNKRRFVDFGDSVLYQQIVRLITKFDMNSIFSDGGTGDSGSNLNTVKELLKNAVTTNYKEVKNGDITSLFFYNVDLGAESAGVATETITEYMQSIFAPFEDKIDPLTNKYLGFKFSTLGTAEITRLVTSMQYFVSTPRSDLGEILTGLVIDLDGDSTVIKKRGVETVPFTGRMSFDYSLRISTNIVIDTKDYVTYEYGCYEYVGDLFIPYLDLELDALIRTDVNEVDPEKGLTNKTNKVFAQFYDKSNNDVIIGLYYKDELTYIDITNLQHLYGGIKFEDIGLPKAFKEGFNLGELLTTVFDLIDQYLVLMVDDLLKPSDGTSYDALTEAIMNNMESTMKDPDVPSSRNTIRLRVNMELIRIVLRETSENGTEYTNKQLISLIDEMFGIELESIAAILGMNVDTLMETTYIDITYDVDEYSIKIEVFTNQYKPEGDLVLKLILRPTHVGEEVKISFPQFDNFKPLQKVMTYSGNMEGQVIFAATEEVDLSDLIGAFIGDLSGKNTPYILPESASIYFTAVYDQYIRDQVLANGRWTRAGRSAFNAQFYVIQNNERVNLFRIYANDVSFDTADPVEELGYVWVDILCVPDIPKMKIREDLFIESLYQYMGMDVSDDQGITIGLTTILQVMMEDSWLVFEPDVIRITTSNQTFKDFFRVDELIGTVSAQIGFRQRVFNIDELEANFAMYTVAELSNIAGGSPYEITLHDKIKVYFDFGNRVVEKDFLFNYDPATIAVTNNTDYYYPATKELFMGMIRSYQVRITGGNRGKSKINSLVNGDTVWVWEPLRGGFPDKAAAFYGETANQQYNYDADFSFFAYYDRSIDYYIVPNTLGYKILYDKKHNVYIVDLYENHKIDKVYELLDAENDTVLLRNFKDIHDLEYYYNISAGLYGYYVVDNLKCKLLYNIIDDYYVVEREEDIAKARILLGNEAVIYTMALTVDEREMSFDLQSGYYYINVQGYDLLYKANKYHAASASDRAAIAVILGIAENSVSILPSSVIEWSAVDRDGSNWNDVDWRSDVYNNIQWKTPSWETMTLEGGLFIVDVVIGRGKMATFRDFIDVKVLNRTVETDKYVNINLYDSQNEESYKVKAPVADYVEVDPYVYILLRADYENNLKETGAANLGANFAEWFFKKYNVTISFTDIYFNDNDTPDSVGSFNWNFEYYDEKSSYKEQNIHNRVQNGDTETTYIYTNFNGQIIALGVTVVSRNIDYIMFEGESAINTYTVDALIESTYTIPRYPVIYFKETDSLGNPLTLDFANFSKNRSTIFTGAPAQISDNDLSVTAVPPGMTKFASVIRWSNPVAENVKLINEKSPVTGTVLPFFRSNTNVTTSFVDIKNFVDPASVWFLAGWFSTPIIRVAVEIPDKIVRNFTVNLDGTDYLYSDISVQQGSEYGRFYADPYDVSTWLVPSNIEVRFENLDGTFYSKRYDVEWDLGTHLELVNGKYRLKNLSTGEAQHFVLTTRIGNPQVNYIELSLLVTNMSGNVSRVQFLSSYGNVLAGSMDNPPDYTVSDTLITYSYEVDTYARFEIPASLRILFTDGTIRTYTSRWENNPPWKPGEIITISSEVGSELKTYVPLTFIVEDRTVTGLEFINHSDDEEITYHIDTKSIYVSNVYFESGKLNGRTPFEYLLYLFEGIEVAFQTDGSGNPVLVTDALSSVMYTYERTFDSQKVRSVSGQRITVQLGQGPQADDYFVYFKANGIDEMTSGAIDTVIIEPFDIETNAANYGPDKPFRLSEEISLEINYASGKLVFGALPKDNDTRPAGDKVDPSDVIPLNNPWYVLRPETMPAGYSDSDVSSTMYGIAEGQELSSVSWETMMNGGYVWVTTMLPDCSRVFRRLEIAYIDIGDSYGSSPDYTGPFKIVNGLITISNIYSVYPLSEKLTAALLPSHIVTNMGGAVGVTIPVYNWHLVVSTEFLSYINYMGQAEFLLATASVVGETIELRMTVLPCVVSGIAYTDTAAASKSFASSPDGTVYFDAYTNYGYEGNFVLPKNLNLIFDTGYSHTNINTVYYIRNTTNSYNSLSAIPYTIKGHSLSGVSDSNELTMRLILADGQVYNFKMYFYDKTVEYILVNGYQGTQHPNKHAIDPYGDREVPLTVTIVFSEGVNLTYKVPAWVKPSDYEVKYDTYKRILSYAPDNAFKLTSSLIYPGLQVQQLDLDVTVIDRVMTEWQLGSGVSDFLAGNAQNPNSTFAYTDPFAGRASSLPQVLQYANVYDAGSVLMTTLPIIWKFSDSDISAEGTVVMDIYNKYGKIVRGYIQNEEYGQPVTLRLFVNRWEFGGIRRPLANGEYQIMNEDIRFFFSQITGASSYSHYQIIVKETVVSASSLTVQHVNVNFYPEDLTAPVSGADYRILWDSEAKSTARSNIQASGRFYLANALGQIKLYPADTVYYQFEKPNISELDFGYGYGTTNNAVYVINPLDPVFELTATAKGTLNQDYNADLGIVRVRWGSTVFSDTYLKGGIYRGYTVTVSLVRETYTYTQNFNLMLVFLDMSPTDAVEMLSGVNANPGHNLVSEIRTSYALNSYSGAVNPYRDSYSQSLVDSLNAAVTRYGLDQDDNNVIHYNNIIWEYADSEIPRTVTQETTIYSRYVTIGSRTYTTNFVRLVIKLS